MEKQIGYLNRDTLNSNPALSEKSLEPYKMNKDQILVKPKFSWSSNLTKFIQTKTENNNKRQSECGVIMPSDTENVPCGSWFLGTY